MDTQQLEQLIQKLINEVADLRAQNSKLLRQQQEQQQVLHETRNYTIRILDRLDGIS